MSRKEKSWSRKATLKPVEIDIPKKKLTPEQAAEYLNISVRTLAKWRSIGAPNIPYSKVGRCIRYSLSDLDAYLAKHTFHSVEG